MALEGVFFCGIIYDMRSGTQDTITPNKNYQYFYKCYIVGNVDFSTAQQEWFLLTTAGLHHCNERNGTRILG